MPLRQSFEPLRQKLKVLVVHRYSAWLYLPSKRTQERRRTRPRCLNLPMRPKPVSMGERMRALDWSKTPLGAAESWRQSIDSVPSRQVLIDTGPSPSTRIHWKRWSGMMRNERSNNSVVRRQPTPLGETDASDAVQREPANSRIQIWAKVGEGSGPNLQKTQNTAAAPAPWHP
jgi:hypothetical protein